MNDLLDQSGNVIKKTKKEIDFSDPDFIGNDYGDNYFTRKKENKLYSWEKPKTLWERIMFMIGNNL